VSSTGKFATETSTTRTVPPSLQVTALAPKSVQEAKALVEALASTNPQFAALLKQGISPANALARFGEQLFAAKRFAEAAQIFRSASALSPADPILWTNAGTALDCAGSFPEAAACLERSLELARDQADTWLLLGFVRKKTGDLAGTEIAYRSAIKVEPKSAVAWQCLGLLKDEQRECTTAIEYLSKAVELGASDPAVLANLGKLHYQIGEIPKASEIYKRVVTLDPSNMAYREMARKLQFVSDLLRGQSVESALGSYKESSVGDGTPTGEDQIKLLREVFGHLSGFGHLDEAKRVGEKLLQLQPDDAVVNYLMKAVGGEERVQQSPSEYIVEYFDSFANGFDAKLVDVLRYEVPAKICAAVQRAVQSKQKYQVVDAGCGTGLCGPLLRPLAASLVGVDLSPKMLDQAGKRGLYDELVCEELIGFLNRSPDRFDLVVAADVVVYIGDLTSLFAAAAKSIRAGGHFAFSTESWGGETYLLQPSGRFAHSPSYVRAVAERAFSEQDCIETMIRLEANVPTNGNLFVFRRRS
jgi:predicted TPR repeat methyltransferase